MEVFVKLIINKRNDKRFNNRSYSLFFFLRSNQVNLLVYGQDSKKIGMLGRQNKNIT